jgi:hypothetical protein
MIISNLMLLSSSFLLVIPAIYAYSCGQTIVAILSFVCFATSVMKYATGKYVWAIIDKHVVQFIALAFSIHAITLFNVNIYFRATVASSLCAMMLYMFNMHTHIIDSIHSMVHFISMIGMLCYVHAMCLYQNTLI